MSLRRTRSSARAPASKKPSAGTQVSASVRKAAAQGAHFDPKDAATYNRSATGALAYAWAKAANKELAESGDFVGAVRAANRAIQGGKRSFGVGKFTVAGDMP